jgi:NADH-ubiquinone oxidoreductase chain 3
MSTFTFFIIFVPILAIILLLVNLLLAPHNPYLEKISVFECGFHSFLGQNRSPMHIGFFLFGLLFLLFDLEILMILPYIVSAMTNNLYGLLVMLVFTVILAVGLMFEIGKNALLIFSKQTNNDKEINNKHYNIKSFKQSSLLSYNITSLKTLPKGVRHFSTTTVLYVENESPDIGDNSLDINKNSPDLDNNPSEFSDSNKRKRSESEDLEELNKRLKQSDNASNSDNNKSDSDNASNSDDNNSDPTSFQDPNEYRERVQCDQDQIEHYECSNDNLELVKDIASKLDNGEPITPQEQDMWDFVRDHNFDDYDDDNSRVNNIDREIQENTDRITELANRQDNDEERAEALEQDQLLEEENSRFNDSSDNDSDNNNPNSGLSGPSNNVESDSNSSSDSDSGSSVFKEGYIEDLYDIFYSTLEKGFEFINYFYITWREFINIIVDIIVWISNF